MGLLAVFAFLLLLSFVRVVTDANDLTSSGTIGAALAPAVPIAMAGLGGLWSERAGVVNIGLEGMMILGTWFGGYAAYNWGPWYGVLFGAFGGALGGLLHAIATVTFGVDHIVSGVAINILALGWTRYLSSLTFANYAGGGDTQSPPLPTIDRGERSRHERSPRRPGDQALVLRLGRGRAAARADRERLAAHRRRGSAHRPFLLRSVAYRLRAAAAVVR